MTDVEQRELDALSREIEELKEENDKLEQYLKGRVAAVKGLQERIQTLTTSRGDHQPQKPMVEDDAQSAQIKGLEEQLQEHTVELTSIQTQIETLQRQLTAKDARYEALNQEIERVNERRGD